MGNEYISLFLTNVTDELVNIDALINEISILSDNQEKINKWEFVELPVRPMVDIKINIYGMKKADILKQVAIKSGEFNKNSILRITFDGNGKPTQIPATSEIRNIIPPTMNVYVKNNKNEIRTNPPK